MCKISEPQARTAHMRSKAALRSPEAAISQWRYLYVFTCKILIKEKSLNHVVGMLLRLTGHKCEMLARRCDPNVATLWDPRAPKFVQTGLPVTDRLWAG